MDGPDGELNSSDANKPNDTDIIPPTIDKITILVGLSDKFLAMAAGIISMPVINNKPTIFMAIAIMAAIKIVKMTLALSGFIPSASARS